MNLLEIQLKFAKKENPNRLKGCRSYKLSRIMSGTKRGRYFWVVPILEIITIIAYFAIGFGGIMNGAKNFDFVGMFESVKTAIWFLIIAIIAITVLCFLPPFKSRYNKFCAIWNIIWLAFTFYGMK